MYRLLISLLLSASAMAGSNDIRLNQIGYYPKSIKQFMVVETNSGEFEIKDHLGAVKFKGMLLDNGRWDASGERVKVGDFTKFSEPGMYRISVPGKEDSFEFKIGPDIYREVLTAAMRTYYFQRASMALEEKYAGKYARAMGHSDDSCAYHASSGRTEGSRSSPGGWYDAGDYNKYVVNAGVTVGTLLGMAELIPGVFPDNSLNIPESGNGVRDVLDEIKYELRWLLTMQDDDGGVFFKLTTKGFPGFIMPAEDKAQRFVVGKSTSSALNFAAVAAQAARVYRTVDRPLSDQCLIASERAWNWASQNNHVVYANPPDIKTGAYSHTEFDNESFWAAAELLITTGKDEYLDYVRKHVKPAEIVLTENWRNYVRNLGEFSLANLNSRLTQSEKKSIQKSIVTLADRLSDRIRTIPYRVPLDRFAWGSNSDILDEGIVMALAFKYTGDLKYLDSLVETVDYVFGKNATGYSFVTGFGSRTPMHPHHRPSEADKIPAPIPGFVVGGPNSAREDSSGGVVYASLLPAKSYTDQLGSYASNEIAINWNAPLVYVLAFLQTNMAEKHSVDSARSTHTPRLAPEHGRELLR